LIRAGIGRIKENYAVFPIAITSPRSYCAQSMHEQVQTLVDAGRLDSKLGETVSQLEPGVFCLHKSWGPGVIKEWDLFGDKMIIDFEGKPGHEMKLQFAANSLEALDNDHIFAKFVGDPEATKQFAIDDPISFAFEVLTSFGGSLFLDHWEDRIKGRIIPDEKYKSWWESSKKKIRTDRRFVLPSKRNLPFELRDSDVSPAEGLIGDFGQAKDIKAKISILESIGKDLPAFDEPAIQLEEILKSVSPLVIVAIRRSPGAAVELLIARDDVVAEIEGIDLGDSLKLSDVLRNNKKKFPEILKGMGVGRQRQVYDAIKDAYADEWSNELIACMEGSGARAIGEVTKYLSDKGEGKLLSDHLLKGLAQRSLGFEMVAWICKERKGLSEAAFAHKGISASIISALERDHLDETTPKTNRLHDLLIDDTELIPDLLVDSDRAEIRHFTRRIRSTPVFETLNKNSLLARIVKKFPLVEDLITGEKKEEKGAKKSEQKKPTSFVVSWESLQARQEKLDDIINKKIPENSKEIGIAREHGDLKENAEFKAAKQQQAILMRQKAELEVEVSTARGTDFSNAITSSVSVGTIVELEDVDSGSSESVTMLGAWDTDTEKGIISYLSGMGNAMLGKSVGDEIELSTEREGETRLVQIKAISAFAKGDS
jgi:transcription elongation GreA/GreB family factor